MPTGRSGRLPYWGEYGEYGGPNHSGEKKNPNGSLYIDPETNKPQSFYNDPIDNLDDIFRKHDEAYRDAKTPADITRADLALINDLKNYNPYHHQESISLFLHHPTRAFVKQEVPF